MNPADPSFRFAEVWQRATRGFLALVLRGGIGKLIVILSMIVLSRLLSPTDFGTFIILQLPIGWLNLVADAGIGGALTQRPFLSPQDEPTGFALRLLLATLLGLLLILLATLVQQHYNLSATNTNMLRWLTLGPVISALGMVPGVRLNRQLKFERLALAELGSLVAGQGTAVFLAWSGYGLWSLVAGSLATSISGTALVNLFAPWRPHVALSISSARQLLRFGLPYQGQGIIHLAKEQVVPALGGIFFANTQVGYLTWSQDIARWPRIPADYVARIGFSSFARLQQNPEEMSRLLHKALSLVCWLSFGATAVAISLAPIAVVPIFGETWLPAVPALIIFLAQTPLDALAAVLLPLIYATGHAGTGLRLSVMWMGLTWLFSAAILFSGTDWRGLPVAFGLATAVALILIIRHLPTGIQIQWRSAIGLPLLVSLIVGGLLYWIGFMLP